MSYEVGSRRCYNKYHLNHANVPKWTDAAFLEKKEKQRHCLVRNLFIFVPFHTNLCIDPEFWGVCCTNILRDFDDEIVLVFIE